MRYSTYVYNFSSSDRFHYATLSGYQLQVQYIEFSQSKTIS